MKLHIVLAALGLGVSALAGEAAAAQALEAAQPTAADVEASRLAVGEADVDRLYDDRDYALEILRHLDVLDAATEDVDIELAIDSLRLTALSTVGEHDRIRTVVDRLLARRPADPAPYGIAWWAALSIPDTERAVALVETASREVAGIGWAALREALGPTGPAYVLSGLAQSGEDATRFRLAEALFRIGWAGDGGEETTDRLRKMLLDHRLDQGDRAAAADLAAGLTTPDTILSLIALRRYDPLLAPDLDRVARLQAVLDAHDRRTAEALTADAPPGRAFDRSRYLRGIGRPSEALAVLEPFTRDVAATVAADQIGMWLVNEAAYALVELGRTEEAVALMERLLALPVAENGELIGPYINHATILLNVGRPSAALDHAMRLDREFAQYANDYGRMWIAAALVCSLASLDRAGEAAPALERLRQGSEANPAALMRAWLCLGDLVQAEGLAIRRLESDDPESMVLAFQDYAVGAAPADPGSPEARLIGIRDRPAVRAALERVGRVLQLPLARTYWGSF